MIETAADHYGDEYNAAAERPWGQEELTVEDHEGNWLTFWKKLG